MTRPHARFQIRSTAPAAYAALSALDDTVAELGLEPMLHELVRLRASQLNGCAYCIDMHTKDARARGETEQRLYMLQAWRESPMLYTARERAALAWTESVTLLSETRVPDDVYALARAGLDETELAALTMAVVVINAWNRVAVSSRLVPGAYVSSIAASAASEAGAPLAS